jgi:hypothetical protein
LLAISKEVDTVLTVYCSSTTVEYHTDNGIEVVTGVQGTVAEAVVQCRKQACAIPARRMNNLDFAGTAFLYLLKRSGIQLVNLLLTFVGVVLLIGLFNAFISNDLLSSIFSGNVMKIHGIFFISPDRAAMAVWSSTAMLLNLMVPLKAGCW